MAWENIKETTTTSSKESLDFYKLQQHKTWFGEYFSRFLNERVEVNMQWLQDPKQSTVDNLTT